MYIVNQFEDRHFTAISVPPPTNKELHKDFQELSRIHFYLGHTSIEAMIKAVEKASLTDIEKGIIPIYFAVKEIQEFFHGVKTDLSTDSKEKLDPAIYFNKTFSNILSNTIEVLDNAYKNPTQKRNVESIQVMMELTHEVSFLYEELHKTGIKTDEIKTSIDQISAKYKKIIDLKNNYENFAVLKEFNSYEEKAKKSVISQLKQPYDFNYTELAKIYMPHDGNWVSTLEHILHKQKDIDKPNYVFNEKEAKELKESFLKQIKGLNMLLSNGVVNYVYSFAACISQEIFLQVEKSLVSPEENFLKEVHYHEHEIKRGKESIYVDESYHALELAKLNDNKDSYIERQTNNNKIGEQYLTVLNRQEANIFQTLDKIRVNVLHTKLKDSITFNGDITNGFVVGVFDNSEKILLIHKEPFVHRPEAVYAMIMEKEQYENLVKNKKLIFSETFKKLPHTQSSNFWSYGQFLQEIRTPQVQQFFLGKEFALIDQTIIKEIDKKKKLAI